jgi:hypothetical protein
VCSLSGSRASDCVGEVSCRTGNCNVSSRHNLGFVVRAVLGHRRGWKDFASVYKSRHLQTNAVVAHDSRCDDDLVSAAEAWVIWSKRRPISGMFLGALGDP